MVCASAEDCHTYHSGCPSWCKGHLQNLLCLLFPGSTSTQGQDVITDSSITGAFFKPRSPLCTADSTDEHSEQLLWLPLFSRIAKSASQKKLVTVYS